MLNEKVYSDKIVANIDDCLMDIKEELEKPEKKTLSNEQKLLSHGRRRKLRHSFRFVSRDDAAKAAPAAGNIESRNTTFNIFDLNQDQLLNAGELFLFHKYSVIFNKLTKADIHLIY